MSEYARPPRAPRGRRDRRGSSTRARCVARASTLRARARARRRSSARAGGRERRARAGRREISRESITHAFIHSLGRKKETLVHARERRRAARDFCDEDSVRALYVYRCSPSGGTFDRDAQKEYHRERGRARVFRTFRRALDEVCFLSVFKRRVVSFVDRRCVILDPPSPIVREKVCLFVLYHSRASRASLGFILRSHPSC